MLDFNLKAKIIKKLLNSRNFKKYKESKASQNHSQLAVPLLLDRALTAAGPPLNELILKETELKAREDALEKERLLFQEEQTVWTTNMAAQKKKQTLIRRGAAIMFRTNRLEAQQELEKHEKTMHSLETGLLQTAQQELELIDQERAKVIGNLLAATATQVFYAAASLTANARANTISSRLTDALDTAHYERLRMMEMTEKVHVKSAELDLLMSQAKAEHIKAQESFKTAQSYVSRFSSAAEAIAIAQEQIELHVMEDRERLSKAMDKERGDALEEARFETKKRLAALRDARTAFEKLREAEKANLAKGYARIEHSRVVVDMEKELVKKEMVRARLLAIKAEQERAASVDAKKAALEELQAARLMRDESRRALHKLVALADEIAIPNSTSEKLVKNATSPVATGDKVNIVAELSEGMMSRFGFYNGDRRASSQGEISGPTSSINKTERDNGSGLQKRCTSLNINPGNELWSPIPFGVSRPRFQPYGSVRNKPEPSVELVGASSATDPVDVTTPISRLNEKVDADRPIESEYDAPPILKPCTEKCDKQPSRMKLGSIGNTAYQMR